jgi:hypothetical protein
MLAKSGEPWPLFASLLWKMALNVKIIPANKAGLQ